MARSIKPTLKLIGLMCLPLHLVAGIYLYQTDSLSLENIALVLIGAPVAIVFFVLASLTHPARFGVPSDNRKALDAAKYLKQKDEQ